MTPTAEEILAKWPGGIAEVARDLGVPYMTVYSWAQRGMIPTDQWESLLDFAKARGIEGITVETLMLVRKGRPDRRTERSKKRGRSA